MPRVPPTIVNALFFAFVAVATSVTLVAVVLVGDQSPYDPVSWHRKRSGKVALSQRPLTATNCEEILLHEHSGESLMRAAIVRLAVLKTQTTASVWCELVRSLSSETPDVVQRNLSRLVVSVSEDGDESFRQQVTDLARFHSQQMTRRIAFAAWVVIDDCTRDALEAAGDGKVCELLSALPLVDHFAVNEQLYDLLRAFATEASETDSIDPVARDVALRAAVLMAHTHEQLVQDLIEGLRGRASPSPLTTTISRLPVSTIPETDLGFVASRLIARIAATRNLQDPDRESLLRLCREIGHRMPTAKSKRLFDRLRDLGMATTHEKLP